MTGHAAMDCEQLADRLTDLMEGDLDETDETAALEHLASCERCEAVLAGTHAAADLARKHGRIELSDADRDRMLGAVFTDIEDGAG